MLLKEDYQETVSQHNIGDDNSSDYVNEDVDICMICSELGNVV